MKKKFSLGETTGLMIMVVSIISGTLSCNNPRNGTQVPDGLRDSVVMTEDSLKNSIDSSHGATASPTSSSAGGNTTDQPLPAAGNPFSVSGMVTAITDGKDGYMADLKGDDGKQYSMTVSILRLERRFRRFAIGDKVTVSGDTIHLGEKVNVRVKDYKAMN